MHCALSSWCGQVTALAENSYAEFIDKCTTVTFATAALCACVLVTIFLLPVMAPRNCPGIFFNVLITSAIVLVTITSLMWIGQTATWHRDAVDDLMQQLVRSMDTQLLASLQASIKLVKEAHNMWSFTGLCMHHLLFSLSELESWFGRCTSIQFIQHESVDDRADGRLLFKHKAFNVALWYYIWLRAECQHHNRWCSSIGPKLLRQCRHSVSEVVLY